MARKESLKELQFTVCPDCYRVATNISGLMRNCPQCKSKLTRHRVIIHKEIIPVRY